MLVLSRKQNERIVVGGSVVVTVVRISGDKVRLGINAPADVRVIRDEVADRVIRDEVADRVIRDEVAEGVDAIADGKGVEVTGGESIIAITGGAITGGGTPRRCFVA